MATNLRKYINNFATTLDGAVAVPDTSITVTEGSDLPVITGSEFYLLTLTDVATGLLIEVVKVTARTGDVLTVVRAQGGTLALAWLDLDVVEMRATADSFTRLAEGNQLVGTTDTPTFTDVIIGTDTLVEVRDHTYANLASGVITGGLITINGGDAAKFDISAGHGVIIDYYTDAENPVLTEVTWTAFTAVTVTDIATTEFTCLSINSGGAIEQKAGASFTESEKRDIIDLGRVSHVDNTVINTATSRGRLGFAQSTLLTDLVVSLGALNSTGNIYSANGANLFLDKSTGTSFGEAVSYDISNKDPHTSVDAVQVAPTLFTFYQDGSGGRTLVELAGIDPDQYDDGSGTLAAVANNKFTIQRLYLAPAAALTGVEYGQNVYNSLAEASAALFTETHNRLIATTSLHRGWLIVKKGTTDLTVTANASFITAANIQGAAGGSGAAAVAAATMQSSYDNSPDPERILDDTKSNPAISTRDASSPVSGNLYEWTDFAGTTDYETLTTALKTYGVNVDHGAFYLDIAEISTPANPAANVGRLYVKDDTTTTTLYFRDSAGVETDLLAAGGGGDPDQNLWLTIDGDTGSTAANVTTDTLTIAGGTGITTAMSGDTLTVTGDTASTSVVGVVELATQAEVNSGIDTGRTITPATLGLSIQDGQFLYDTDISGSDAYFMALTPTLAAYVVGQVFSFKADVANTGGATLNIDNLGVKALLKQFDQALDDGDIAAGQIVTVVYDGTNFQMQSQTATGGGSAPDHVITSGSGAPVSTPANVGDMYVDTNNNQFWVAVATTGSSDWRQVHKEESFPSALGIQAKISDTYAATQFASRTISNDDGGISWTNGDGVSGDPTSDLSFQNLTTISGDVDPAADWLAIRDDSASAMRKVHPEDLGAWQRISSATASSSSSISFTGLSTKYRDFIIVLSGVTPAADAAELELLTSTDNGTSYDTGASDYKWASGIVLDTASVVAVGDTADDAIRVSTTIGNASIEGVSGSVKIHDPQSTTKHCLVSVDINRLDNTGDFRREFGGGVRSATADVDAIRFIMDSGNIATGTFTLYGVLA